MALWAINKWLQFIGCDWPTVKFGILISHKDTNKPTWYIVCKLTISHYADVNPCSCIWEVYDDSKYTN